MLRAFTFLIHWLPEIESHLIPVTASQMPQHQQTPPLHRRYHFRYHSNPSQALEAGTSLVAPSQTSRTRTFRSITDPSYTIQIRTLHAGPRNSGASRGRCHLVTAQLGKRSPARSDRRCSKSVEWGIQKVKSLREETPAAGC